MPGISGVEMHERLIAQGIAPPTIFITVCPNPALGARVMSNGALVLLEKPPSSEAMVHWLSRALGVA
jgi:FixJ family two-component response regulator